MRAGGRCDRVRDIRELHGVRTAEERRNRRVDSEPSFHVAATVTAREPDSLETGQAPLRFLTATSHFCRVPVEIRGQLSRLLSSFAPARLRSQRDQRVNLSRQALARRKPFTW